MRFRTVNKCKNMAFRKYLLSGVIIGRLEPLNSLNNTSNG